MIVVIPADWHALDDLSDRHKALIEWWCFSRLHSVSRGVQYPAEC